MIPECNSTVPELFRPSLLNSSWSSSTLSPLFLPCWKLVPSAMNPPAAAAVPATISSNWPTVMREGMALGFMRMLGLISVILVPITCPLALRICIGNNPHGMSSLAILSPMTPFCPWRALNLSPMMGTAGRATCNLILFLSFESAKSTLVTIPGGALSSVMTLWSLLMLPWTLTVLPITAVPPLTTVPGGTNPDSHSRE